MANEPQMVRVEVIAQLFGLSVEQCYRLTKEGVISSVKVQGENAKMYPFIDSIKAYIAHLRDKLQNRNQTTDAIKDAELLKKELEARDLERKIALAERDAHYSADVRRVWNDVIGSFKIRLWAMPQILAVKLVGIDDHNIIVDIIHAEITELCGLLMEYDPSAFYARNQDYLEAVNDDEAIA
jgi:hypothetical protein